MRESEAEIKDQRESRTNLTHASLDATVNLLGMVSLRQLRNLVIVYHMIITVIDQTQYSCNINTRLLTPGVGKIEWR